MRRHLAAAIAGGAGAALAGLVSCSAYSEPLSPPVFATYLTSCEREYPVILQAPVQRSIAHAMAESGLATTAIHDNATGRSYAPETEAEAVAIARQLLAAGHKIDAGVMQVDSANWPAYGLAVETVFDPRANICAGARILGEAFQIERRAACRYNTGHPDCGSAYPDMVQRAEARLGSVPLVSRARERIETPSSSPEPPAWNLFARARRARQLASPQPTIGK